MLIWLIVAVVVIAILGSTIASAFRWLARLAVSVFLALLISVPAGVLLMETDENEVALALLLTVPLAAALFWILGSRPDPLAARSTPSAAAKPRRRPLKCGTFRRTLSEVQIAQVWDRLAEEAPEQSARIAVVRRSTERSRTALKTRHLDTSAYDALIMLEKRMPELIDKELTHVDDLPASARTKAIDELVELLERIAADCERQRTTDAPPGAPETLILRQHIERYLNRDRQQAFRP